jgi:hypothetical protein
MGTFAETAIVDYRYHLPTEEKQTSVFCFPFAASNGSLPLQQTN